jgi:hypothetical protein
VKDHGRRFDVFRDIIEPPAADNLPVAEYALFPCNLRMEEFGSHRVAFAVPAEGAAYRSEQDMGS